MLAPASEKLVSSLSVGDGGRITVAFASPLEGQTLVYEPMKGQQLAGRWVCTGGSLKEKYRPDDCREPLPALQDQGTYAKRPKDTQSEAPHAPPATNTIAGETPPAATPFPEDLANARREPSSPAASTNSIQQMFTDPDLQSFRKSLYILSVPSGLQVYVAPANKLPSDTTSAGVTLMGKRFFLGRTPLRVELEPGQYKVAVQGDKNVSIIPRYDGEMSRMQALVAKNTFMFPAKLYAIEKKADRAGLVVSLLWPEKVPLWEFVNLIPDDDLFNCSLSLDWYGFRETFVKHDIPESDWEHLMSMLCRTGKAVWYNDNIKDTKMVRPRDYLILEFVALGDDRKPNVVAERPASELLQPTRAAHAPRSKKKRD